ncbi:MAG: hypothetical protein K0S55_261 [Clostridia bacterium]|nr:hypothetical protein [Clostridia bacterium]
MDILKFKKANCKNCYRCIKECPVKAIEFKEHQAQIITDECLLCGRCVVACPQNAKEARQDVSKVIEYIKNGEKVIASIAPSFIAGFNVSGIREFENYIKMLGFYAAEETALGAYSVKSEYENILNEKKQSVVISSCCHSINKLIQKYYCENIRFLAKVVSPMQAHAIYLKQKYPGCKVVFIGPCISKKEEAEIYNNVNNADVVITFDELNSWFNENNIEITIENNLMEQEHYRSRFFPKTGGIIQAMTLNDEYKYAAVDGIENCINVLKEITEGNIKGYFIEMSACVGSCINGPAIKKLRGGFIAAETKINDYAKSSDLNDFLNNVNIDTKKFFKADIPAISIPGEKTIREILAKVGKFKKEDELNCGSCGYPTCRDKAIAVYQGKAELEMCLPFMKERAESLSDKIIESTPNAIIALDNNLNIQQINNAAAELFSLKDINKYNKEYVSNILDPVDIISVLETGININSQKKYLSIYKKHVEQSIVLDKIHHLLIIIMKDITEQENKNEENKQIRLRTVELTDKVIAKQMRIAQEIASLLGETTAETKIALTNLKNFIGVDDINGEKK